jgi:FimV-like protein
MTQAPRPASNLFKRSALWAALCLSVLGNAQALTLSKPVVQSKEGEALQVEIDIANLSEVEQANFQASLASAEAYQAAKMEAPGLNGIPADIQVQLLRRPNGRYYLKVSSKQGVNSNFVDLLIDFRWATGRMVRDISVSLDDGGQPVKKSSQLATMASHDKVKVQRGETASEIAVRNMPNGVSLDQMLLAMLRSNPEAFVDSNVNRLKSGSLLTMPSAQQAKATSREEARKEIQIQTKDFHTYRAELAARAPGGAAPKATRDSAGKLEAQVENKKSKAAQDKLTLAKPNKNNAEDKIAQQREAQDVAKRAEELSRNLAELGKIAAATASEGAASGGVLPVTAPASTASSSAAWLDELSNNPLAPVGAGGLIALMVLMGLWSRHTRKTAEQSGDNIQGLPPLNVKFDLDLPHLDDVGRHDHSPMSFATSESSSTHEASHTDDAHEDDHIVEETAHAAPAPNPTLTKPARPTLAIPDISLELDDTQAHPLQVRMDLAQELWDLGQLHTSRALMEEVMNETSGDMQAKAKQWLAERG